MIKQWIRSLLSPRTIALLRFDLLRAKARLRARPVSQPVQDRLHLGCGRRRVNGWLNVDVADSDYDVDLAGRLPWPSGSFAAIVSQQVIEHLELLHELVPLLKELRRVSRQGGEIWLACPDMEKVCSLYVQGRTDQLVDDRISRWADFSLKGAPSQHIVNIMFHQGGEHKNLYDFGLLAWALLQAGYIEPVRVRESDLLDRFPEFPRRNDDFSSLYVRASVPSSQS